jgi:hypothetical protein
MNKVESLLVRRGLKDWYLGRFRYRTCIWCNVMKKELYKNKLVQFMRYTRNSIM